MIWLELVSTLAGGAVSVWLWASMFISLTRYMGKEPKPILLTIKAEVKPFVPTLALLDLFATLMRIDAAWGRFQAVAICVLALILYVANRNDDDDDRWKRRRKKAAEKIRSLGHRLVVAPAQG